MKPIFFMMVGLPASGKSTYAKTITVNDAPVNIHSSDLIRAELYGDENIQEDNDLVFKKLSERIKSDLINNQDTIYDATNIDWKRRKAFLESLNKIQCYKVCVFIATSYQDCLRQNKKRERVVPEYVIKNMYKNIWIPQRYEGWDNIAIIINSDYVDINTLFNGENGLNYISQDNPNHTLTIGNHCLKADAELELLNDRLPLELYMAALLHDTGKRFTKGFKNSKGEETDIAHYYQHHLVSAYDSMFYTKNYTDEQKLKIANYIQWHMQPFFFTEKSEQKFKKLWGEEFYNEIMLLHEADLRAK